MNKERNISRRLIGGGLIKIERRRIGWEVIVIQVPSFMCARFLFYKSAKRYYDWFDDEVEK